MLDAIIPWMASGTVASIQILTLGSVVETPGRRRKALRVEAPAALEVRTAATETLTIVAVVQKVSQRTGGVTTERGKAQVRSLRRPPRLCFCFYIRLHVFKI